MREGTVMSGTRIILLIVWFLLTGPSTRVGAATFQGLGGTESQAYGVSADGKVVVGDRLVGGVRRAFRWAETSGMTGLADVADGSGPSTARAASEDGSVIVGSADVVDIPSTRTVTRAVRWSGGGAQNLGEIPSCQDSATQQLLSSHANGVSLNGSVIVGFGDARDTVSLPSGPFCADKREEAFGWNSGTIFRLPQPPIIARAWGVSPQGTIAVGSGWGLGARQPIVWTSAQAFILRAPSGKFGGEALAVSGSGLVIVGYDSSVSDTGSTGAFRWTPEKGMVGLGVLPGHDTSFALAVSFDGSVVIGLSYLNDFGSTNKVFIWDTTNGMRDLMSVLVEQGANLTGWRLQEASGISADGRTIVGSGINPSGNAEAWIAVLELCKPRDFDFRVDKPIRCPSITGCLSSKDPPPPDMKSETACLLQKTVEDQAGIRFEEWCGEYLPQPDELSCSHCIGFYKRQKSNIEIVGKCVFPYGQNTYYMDSCIDPSDSKKFLFVKSSWNNYETCEINPRPECTSSPFIDGRTDRFTYTHEIGKKQKRYTPKETIVQFLRDKRDLPALRGRRYRLSNLWVMMFFCKHIGPIRLSIR